MNILTDTLPTKIQIKDKIYNVDSNFRNCINIMIALEDEELTIYEKIDIVIKLLYVDKIEEEDIEEAYNQAVKFLDCGEEQKEEISDEESEDTGVRLYSFSKDAKYIYNAIKRTHNIDLDTVEYMHWWKFVYLFMELDQDSFFSQIIYYRRQKSKGKLTKEEAILYYEMRSILDLDYVPESEQEKSDFEKLLESGKKNE